MNHQPISWRAERDEGRGAVRDTVVASADATELVCCGQPVVPLAVRVVPEWGAEVAGSPRVPVGDRGGPPSAATSSGPHRPPKGS